jgi:hypothetical protein
MRPIRSPENSSANAEKFPGDTEEAEVRQKNTARQGRNQRKSSRKYARDTKTEDFHNKAAKAAKTEQFGYEVAEFRIKPLWPLRPCCELFCSFGLVTVGPGCAKMVSF